MWIECKNDATNSIYVEGLTEEPLDFSDGTKVQVTKSVGEELTSRYGSVVPSDTMESDGDETSSDDGDETSSDDGDESN